MIANFAGLVFMWSSWAKSSDATYVALVLHESRPYLFLDSGSGTVTLHGGPIAMASWTTIKFEVDPSNATVSLNDSLAATSSFEVTIDLTLLYPHDRLD
ncbi:hypothetical protein ANCCAN_26832, partial [Ancylostoma caninum]